KMNQRKSIEIANKNNPNHKGNGLESKEPNPSKPTNTNAELGKLAGVSNATVTRAKKIKKENPEAYEKIVRDESNWRREYDNLPSVRKSKSDSKNKNTPKAKKDKHK